MKRNTLTSTFVLCAVMLWQTGCQQQVKTTQKPAAAAKAQKGGPKIEFESLEYDFGKVGPSQKMSGQFKFTNTGDEELKITKIEKCCGAVIKVDKQELAPGESGVLDVTYTSSRTAGNMMKHLYINSNDRATPRATLTIRAETVLKVDYEPRSLKLLLREENAGCPKITLTSTDGQLFSVTSFISTDDCLTAEIDPSVQAKEFTLQPKADIEKLRKRRSGFLRIGVDYSQPESQPETITMMFQTLSRFTIRPSMIVVVYHEPGEKVKKSLVLTSNYGEDFDVESTSSKEGHIKVLGQQKAGELYQFELEITAPSDVKAGRFTDVFTINLKGGEKLGVVCRGIYRAPSGEEAGR